VGVGAVVGRALALRTEKKSASARERRGSTARPQATQTLPSHAVSTPAGGPTSPHPRTLPPRHASALAAPPCAPARTAPAPSPMPPSTTQAPREASFLVGASRAQQPRALGDQAQCSSPVSGAPLLVSHRRMARVDARHRSDSRTVDDSPVETIATSVARSIAPRASKKKAVTVRGVNPRKRIQKKTKKDYTRNSIPKEPW
jgi:hypothetical protein